MLLSIESVKPTAKSLVLKAGGKEYFAKKESGITAGMTIDAEVKDSEYNGKTYSWVEKYRQVANGNGQHAAVAPVSGAAPVWLPFVSNTVAHAIAAGLCNEPGKVSAWAKAAKDAYEALLTI